MADVRPAEPRDLEAIVAMTRTARNRLAHWSPVFFRPAPNVDERHAQYIGFMVSSPSHDTRVAVSDSGRTAAFGVVITQGRQYWLDDLCVADPDDWGDAGSALIDSATNRPTLTCVSPKDSKRIYALYAAQFVSVSSYWARVLGPHDERAVLTPKTGGSIPSEPGPMHTFGGALDPDAPGALKITTDDGYVVGSASTTPPTYDPGGPTCVVDRIVGTNRIGLLNNAMTAAASRGDHQLLVIAATNDDELVRLLRAEHFEQHVLVLARQ
jgi:hypothetical protein